MNLDDLNLVQLNIQEVQEVEGGMIHPEGYSNGIIQNSGTQVYFWGGFFAGLFGY